MNDYDDMEEFLDEQDMFEAMDKEAEIMLCIKCKKNDKVAPGSYCKPCWDETLASETTKDSSGINSWAVIAGILFAVAAIVVVYGVFGISV